MTHPSTVADTLDAAADFLEPEGVWGCTHCAATAIWANQPDHQAGVISAAEAAFIDFIGAGDRYGIYRWNDAPERRKSEVQAKLREAAAKARGQVQP